MKRKMTDKARKAFHANDDMKMRCMDCGRRVAPVWETIWVDKETSTVPEDVLVCPRCGGVFEPIGKYDDEAQP